MYEVLGLNLGNGLATIFIIFSRQVPGQYLKIGCNCFLIPHVPICSHPIISYLMPYVNKLIQHPVIKQEKFYV